MTSKQFNVTIHSKHKLTIQVDYKHKPLSASNRKAAAKAEWPVGQATTAGWETEESPASHVATTLRGNYNMLYVGANHGLLFKNATVF